MSVISASQRTRPSGESHSRLRQLHIASPTTPPPGRAILAISLVNQPLTRNNYGSPSLCRHKPARAMSRGPCFASY